MTEPVETEAEELKHERPRSKIVVRPSDPPPGPAASLDLSRLHALEDRAENLAALARGLSERRLDARARWHRARLVLSEALEFAEKAQPSLAQRIGRAAWPLGQGRALEKGERIPPPSIPARWAEDPRASALRAAEREEQEAREAFERIERQHGEAGRRAGAARELLRRCETFCGLASGGELVLGGDPSAVSAAASALRSAPGYSLPPAASLRWGGGR